MANEVIERSEDEANMTLRKIVAFMDCDGCAKPMEFKLDPGEKQPHGWDLFDSAVDACRGGHIENMDGFSSVQGDLQCLCPECTAKVDELLDHTGAGDRDATEDEIHQALDA